MISRRQLVSTTVASSTLACVPKVFASDGFNMQQYVDELRELVAIDSKTGYEEGANKVIAIFEQRFRSIGWTVTLHQCEGRGKALVATSKPDQSKYDVVVSAHADTVQPVGYAAKYPLKIEGHIAHGAGVGDDKSSLLAAWWLVKGLPKAITDKLNIAFIINPGEEASAPSTLKFFDEQAKKTSIALVYEPGREGDNKNGFVKVRKGSTPLTIRFQGKAAHAGNNPQDGRNAVYAMALAIPQIAAIQKKYPGVTLNSDLVKGGTAPNTIAAEAEVVFDFRYTDNQTRDKVLAEVKGMCDKGFMDGVRSELVVKAIGSALPETEASRKLMAMVEKASAELGQPKPKWFSVGGASDGNKLAAHGAAVVCAMGVVSGNLHDPEHEWSDLSTVHPRIKLGTRVIEMIAAGK